MIKLKLKNLMEFKDREQIRGLLRIATGLTSDNEISEILLKFITDTKWSLLGFVEGPVLYALAGVEKTEAKTGRLHFLAVRPENQKQGLGSELLSQTQKKLKLKVMTVSSLEQAREFFEKSGFQEEGVSENPVGAKVIEMKLEI